MTKFKESKSSSFFEKVFPKNNKKYLTKANFINRDLIIIKKILPTILKSRSTILDYGCGKAELLSWLSKKYKIIGVEKSSGMIAEAIKINGEHLREKIIKGSLNVLNKFPSEKFSIILSIGLLQYLSDKEYKKTLLNFHRILKPGGILVVSMQNLFFDLFTLNRFTLDFYFNYLFTGRNLNNKSIPKDLKKYLQEIMPFSSLPPKTKNIARDNIYVKLTNPFTIKEDLKKFNFELDQIHFYDYFGLPPAIKSKYPDFSRIIEKQLEIKQSTDWRGMIMANAFLCVMKKI